MLNYFTPFDPAVENVMLLGIVLIKSRDICFL